MCKIVRNRVAARMHKQAEASQLGVFVMNNLVPFKAVCEEILGKTKLYSRHSTPHQIKKMYDSFAGD
jgi:hypothetical protein